MKNKLSFAGLARGISLFVIQYSIFIGLANAEPLPHILSDEDAYTYTRIFTLQDQGKFDAAKKLEKELENQMLMGDVLYQRFMSKEYIAKGVEIAAWMDDHHAHPGAENIFKLSKKKQTAARLPSLPTVSTVRGEAGFYNEPWTTKKYHASMGNKVGRIQRAINKRQIQSAANVLNEENFKKSLTPEDYGRLAGRLAFTCFNGANFACAEKWGTIAAEKNSEFGLWTMGLLTYKNEEYEQSQKYFEKMLDLDRLNTNRKVEAAFWAGRAADMAGEARAARRHWRFAVTRPASFYGAMSAAMMGYRPKYRFYEDEISEEAIEELLKTKYGQIALALLQIEKNELAEQHLRYLVTDKSDDALIQAVHALSTSESLPRTALLVAPIIKERGIFEIDNNVILSTQFPLPQWEPRGGWNIDRALLFAIARQESKFKTNAKSHAGATGLLQLMPGTAKLTAVKNGVKINSLDLTKAEDSMFLGQQHVNDLFKLANVDNNIIKMLVSYNAGNGRLRSFERQFETDDPLLYIESFPASETRQYVKKVMSNLWLYRARLDQPISNLVELAQGQWPMYMAHDDYAKKDDDSSEL